MNVKIVATRECNHRPNLEHELADLGIRYELVFVEDRPELVQRFGIRHSPNLVVDDKVVFRGQPSEAELRAYFSGAD
jgi:glutaredoxin